MKYALISDIHGNLPALKAVLMDSKKRGVQKYIFLGDYIEDLPWPNEVTDMIRGMDSSIVIRGNKEDYLRDIHAKDKGEGIYNQMAVMYWNYEELTSENLDYLMSLPKEAEIIDGQGGAIKVAHSSPIFYRSPKMKAFYSSEYYKAMKESPFTHEDFLWRIYEQVCADDRAVGELKEVNCKVSASGHSHLQWHFTYNGVLYINPGACGMPLDFNADAPYSIIEFGEGEWRVQEIRVSYDVDGTVRELKSSSLYNRVEVWSQIIAESLTYAEERMSFFLSHVKKLSGEMGRPTWPVDNDIWRQAENKWPEIRSELRQI